jgi:hypothetical protein
MNIYNRSVCRTALLFAASVTTNVLASDFTLSWSDGQHERRHLASVQEFVGTGKFLEFRSNQAVGSEAYGCITNCSTASNSQALTGNNASWTFSATNCTTLWVIQGYETGDSQWSVRDANTVLGTTSRGITGNDCGANPSVCFSNLTSTGFGSYNLSAGSHSISLRTAEQVRPVDGGWFRVDFRECPAPAPTKAPTKAPTGPTKPPTKKPTKAPTKPTKKPTKKPSPPTSRPLRCWQPRKCAQTVMLINRTCKCNPLLAGNRSCLQKQERKLCCPNNKLRTAEYMRNVYLQARRYCSRF